MRKIIQNKARCKLCGDVLESTSRHDFKWCKCGVMAVDGGHDYIKRCWKPGYEKDEVIEEMNIEADDIS